MPDVFYSFRRCPYAIRARMALASAGLDPEHREILLRDKPAQMLEASPKGTVPVLVLEGGHVFDESLDIMRWALAQRDPDSWMSRGCHDGLDGFLAVLDGPFKTALDRCKYANRHDAATVTQAWVTADAGLQTMARFLGADGTMHEGGPGFHDAAIFPFVRQLAAVDETRFARAAPPALQAWRRRMLIEPCFTRVMKKIPLWRPSDPPRSFQASLI